MSFGLSATPLPAEKVHDACIAAIHALEAERVKLYNGIIAEWRKTSWRMTEQKAKDTLPEHLAIIPRLHRAADEALLKSLLALSTAATDFGKNYALDITATDFQLLRLFY